jgi:hypothetical protein
VTQPAPLAQATRAPGEEWDQGDIVEAVYFAAMDADRPAVLVTPACDIDQSKVDLWTFVALFPDEDVARSLLTKDLDVWQKAGSGLSKNQRDSLSRKVRELIDHRFGRYHWIPVAMGGHPAHVADFTCVGSLPAAEVRETVKRVATLTSSWREQLPARYASYMSRVGTTDFRRDEIDPQVERIVRSLTGG